MQKRSCWITCVTVLALMLAACGGQRPRSAEPTPAQLLPAEIASTAGETYDHGAGVAYLVRVLPHVCKTGVPEIALVGIEGEPEEEIIEEAAALAVKLTLTESAATAYLYRGAGGPA